jgi:sialidase-1
MLFSDNDPFSYRIPAIGKTSTGRLIAVSDYRYSLDDIGRYNYGTANPGIDLVMRYSDDNGATWSETKTIAKGSCVRGTDDCAYGDAAIAVVGEKVLVMAAAGDVMFGNGSATAHNRAVRVFSEDNGQTWTKQDISETLFLGSDATIKNGYTAFFGSGRLAVDENYNGTGKARIYGALLLKKSSGTGNYVIYTDDLGLTWNILGGSQNPVASQDEPKVEILPSGQILLSIRRGGGRQFNVFTYTNKATNTGSWDSNVNGCNNGGSNTCNGEPYCIDAKNADGESVKLLLQSQPKGGSGLYDRRNVTIWYKEITDAKYTSSQIAAGWTQGIQVSTQLSAYSAMTLQDDGKIAFFFEEAPCFGDDQAKGYCMVYVPLTIEEITKGAYSTPEKGDATGIDTIVGQGEKAVFYDLSGRRVANPEKGIYVVNGKKVLK